MREEEGTPVVEPGPKHLQEGTPVTEEEGTPVVEPGLQHMEEGTPVTEEEGTPVVEPGLQHMEEGMPVTEEEGTPTCVRSCLRPWHASGGTGAHCGTTLPSGPLSAGPPAVQLELTPAPRLQEGTPVVEPGLQHMEEGTPVTEEEGTPVVEPGLQHMEEGTPGPVTEEAVVEPGPEHLQEGMPVVQLSEGACWRRRRHLCRVVGSQRRGMIRKHQLIRICGTILSREQVRGRWIWRCCCPHFVACRPDRPVCSRIFVKGGKSVQDCSLAPPSASPHMCVVACSEHRVLCSQCCRHRPPCLPCHRTSASLHAVGAMHFAVNVAGTARMPIASHRPLQSVFATVTSAISQSAARRPH